MGRIIFSTIDVNVEEKGEKKESEQLLTELICLWMLYAVYT